MSSELAKVARESQWGKYRGKAGIGTYLLAGLIYVIPKIGALKLVAVKGPTEATEVDYVHSVMRSVDRLNNTLRRFTPPPTTRSSAAQAAAEDKASEPPPNQPLLAAAGSSQQVPRGSSDPRHPLRNRDLDTGIPVRPAGYPLTDNTYALLLERLTRTPSTPVPPAVKQEVLDYYADLTLPFATKKDPESWAAVQQNLKTLQTMPTSIEPDPFPTYGEDDSGGN